MDVISSNKNPKIVEAALLRAKRSARDKDNLFVLEGAREIGRALANDVNFREWFVCEELLSPDAKNALKKATQKKIPLLHVSKKVFAKLAVRENSDGLFAIAQQNYRSLSQLNSQNANFIVYIQNVEKPGNLGAIFRSADGAGVQAIFLSPTFNDPFNPNALRASLGSICSMPKYQMEFEAFAKFCRSKKITLIAASPHGKQTIYDCDLTQPIALVLGSEHSGLSKDEMQTADQLVQIPMRGISDSLNVSVAAGIMFYEVLRQRL